MIIWNVVKVRYEEKDKYLKSGWEPFAVTSNVSSERIGKGYMTEPSLTEILYLRKKEVL